jgi:exodeoxyribonuclease V alpha subunit
VSAAGFAVGRGRPSGGAETDLFAADRALRAPGLLRAFNDAGVLTAADVHVALRLARLGGETGDDVALAAALAVRGPRMGHVHVDLATARATAAVDDDEGVDVAGLPWPEPAPWLAAVRRSPLVVVGEDAAESRPLRLVGTALYLDRYWREEREVAADLRRLAGAPAGAVDEALLADGLRRLFAQRPDDLQQLACRSAVQRRFTVVAGGPGTGKTTTVARIVALLAEQARAAGAPDPLVALAAPTGKAAARLSDAVHEEAQTLDVGEDVRAQLLALDALTLHRLLGWRPDSQSRFRHDRSNRLPHDAVIVDETSMVSLTLMSRLAEAVRPDARLVLVGDPGQLTSIEAGAVLGDVVGPGAAAGRAGIVVLQRVHRFGRGIAGVAEAIRRGDADATVAALRAGAEGVTWIDVDAAGGDGEELAPLRDGAVHAARAVIEAARGGDARVALERLGAFRILCAHRRGAHGVETWMERIERWLAAEVGGFGAQGRWYTGRPLLVTENDYGLRLFNGDTGVVVADGAGGVTAAFERRGEVVRHSPARLGAVETVYAMTVHKSQGSQFGTAAVLLPEAASQILTRELLYTAVTRARERLIVAGGEEAIRAAVARPVARASGLGWRLWGGDAG